MEALFVTGVDEHGEKIAGAERALLHWRSSKFEDLWRELNVQYDWSERTTSPRHKEIVREFMERVWEVGTLIEASTRDFTAMGARNTRIRRIWWKKFALYTRRSARSEKRRTTFLH